MTIKLEAGKRYRMRNGGKTFKMRWRNTYADYHDGIYSWDKYGRSHGSSDLNIVAEYTEYEPEQSDPAVTPEGLARIFHDTYELLASAFGYETREDTRVFDPESDNGKLMIETCRTVIGIMNTSPPEQSDPEGDEPEYWTTETDRGFREVMCGWPYDAGALEFINTNRPEWYPSTIHSCDLYMMIDNINNGSVYRIKNPNYKPPQPELEVGQVWKHKNYCHTVMRFGPWCWVNDKGHKTALHDADVIEKYEFTGKTIDLSALLGDES